MTKFLILLIVLSTSVVLGRATMAAMSEVSCSTLTDNQEATLEQLLQNRLDHPEQADAIDAQIREMFEQRYAVLVLDSSGFSRLSQQQGIIAALAEVERMRRIVVPIMESHTGVVFKVEVDNVYAVFPSVLVAVQAAQAIMADMERANVPVSIGVGYGDLLTVSGSGVEGQRDRPVVDVYGEEMNLASKLGEDLAQHGELLLTTQAFQQLSLQNAELTQWEPLEHQISGLTVQVHSWRFSSHR